MIEYIILPRQAKDLTGQQFGRLTVLGPVGLNKKHSVLWLCQCKCGGQKTTDRSCLLSGRTQSCGCIHREQLVARNQKHGLVRHPLYGAWATMIMRCINSNTISYPNYGSRGISVCTRWIESFPDFLADVSTLPNYGTPGYTLDRVDNDGNYEPSNVRWSSRAAQRRNSRQIHLITYQDKTQCLADWAKELGIRWNVLYRRIYIQGWTVERAFMTPIAGPGGHASRLKV